MSGDSKRRWACKCWKCNKIIEGDFDWYDPGDPKPNINNIAYCKACYPKVREAEAKELDKYIHLKKRQMLKRAIERLNRQNVSMQELKPAIKAVSEKVKKEPDKFDSSYEIQTAIILVHNRIYAKMQYKIFNYQVDFLLPDIGVVLEIDGDRHQHKIGYDSVRDQEIKKALGPGWDIIRISTKLLDHGSMNLIKAIDAIIDKRQKAL